MVQAYIKCQAQTGIGNTSSSSLAATLVLGADGIAAIVINVAES
jgi:hypothetical protein